MLTIAERTGRRDPAAMADWRRKLAQRTASLEPRIHAFACLAGQAGEAAAASTGSGLLAGVPVGVKDLIDTADLPTTYGSAIFAGHRPSHDALVVRRLREAGAVIVGKTVTTEFAWFHPGPTRNPWNPGHTPGGSSSGSAAAVAAGLVPLAIGSQTAGSVIRPAAFCGVVGFKPSFGAIARTGVQPLAESMDHIGLFARSVADIGTGFAALAGPDRSDPHGWPAMLDRQERSLAGRPGTDPPRIMVPAFERLGRATPAALAALDTACVRLIEAGAQVRRVDWPTALEDFDRLLDRGLTMASVEMSASLGPIVDAHPERTSEALHAIVARGRAHRLDEYLAARLAQRAGRRAFSEALGDFDLLLTIPAAGEAPQGIGATGDPSYCIPWTFLGVPALSFPVQIGPAGLPLGIQLVGRPGDDARFLAASAWCAAAAQMPAGIEPALGVPVE
jgi:Asp-tRNA(Asn)/Glu-tRNA(Gln) amidotransferase A subunit family amidase